MGSHNDNKEGKHWGLLAVAVLIVCLAVVLYANL